MRQRAREELVQRDAERIEIRAIVEAAVHSPRLLGRDVGERAFERRRRLELALLAAQPRRDAEVDQRAAPRLGVVDDVVAADVLVNDVRARARSPRCRRAASRSRAARATARFGRRFDPAAQRDARQVLEHERDLAVVPQQIVRFDDARAVERAQQLELVAIARELARRDRMTLRALDDDARAVARAPRAIDDGALLSWMRLTVLVARKLCCLQRRSLARWSSRCSVPAVQASPSPRGWSCATVGSSART